MGWFYSLLDTSNFPPRWQCGNWTDVHGWTHIVADLAIFGAYASIPAVIALFLVKRKDTPYLPVMWLFAVFILACGIGHLIEATLFWQPWYRLSGLMKVITATVSWATVIALVPIIPQALALPLTNQQLQRENEAYRAIEVSLTSKTEELQRANDELEVFSTSVIDREDRILELKQEVNALLIEAGRERRYQVKATTA